eukprot:CAMPEP_0202693626 /NCGR_PEP_ID=MMETSP1385-20130828/7680_1 /ASSEMBLY_ACC=CAM_ASM_000861 /TAXON_ID=933848 /ORGANISM="Elphidium margaritaceum" /LENGTH=105 /DNA_ID=CAMNT_0049349323 /DNA_START=162 /DNA_END=476 /DNA_ORIENTATION=+
MTAIKIALVMALIATQIKLASSEACSVTFYVNADGTGTSYGPYGPGEYPLATAESLGFVNDVALSMLLSADAGNSCDILVCQHNFNQANPGICITRTVDATLSTT